MRKRQKTRREAFQLHVAIGIRRLPVCHISRTVFNIRVSKGQKAKNNWERSVSQSEVCQPPPRCRGDQPIAVVTDQGNEH